jgi:3'(2'), 5'-bisphosphate nucleotidase
MSSPYSHHLETALLAVQLSATLTSSLQKTVLHSSTLSKSDFSPVTTGDFAVQALLTCCLRSAFPTASFLAEESAIDLRKNPALLKAVFTLIQEYGPAFTASGLAVPTSEEEVLYLLDLGGTNAASDQESLWVFDPIDGTKTFLEGRQYAINCAYLENGVEKIGIIGCPNLPISTLDPDSPLPSEDTIDSSGHGCVIHAVRGEGTWVRPLRRDGVLEKPTRVQRHGDDRRVEDLVWSDCEGYTSTIQDLHQQVAAKLSTPWPGVEMFSSLMKYAVLGLGRASVVVRIFKYTSWRSNMFVPSSLFAKYADQARTLTV